MPEQTLIIIRESSADDAQTSVVGLHLGMDRFVDLSDTIPQRK